MSGPLEGVRIVELAGIGPGPFAAMVLSDLGAEVLRVDRADRAAGAPDPIEGRPGPRHDLLNRGRRSVALDLKTPGGKTAVLRLIERADALIEGFRPGVVERLGIGPDESLEVNPRLVYGRMTGWGQDGPLASDVGHDINYIALGGTLAAIGRPGQPPSPPLSLVGDFGGGGMLLAVGLLAGLLEAQRSGRGQVVDAAMIDGAALLMAQSFALLAAGLWSEERGGNRLDGGAPFYAAYETSDSRYIAVGAIERKFYEQLLDLLGLADESLPDQMDRSGWPALTERFAEIFRRRTRDEWVEAAAGREACLTPVLTLAEAPQHAHHVERGTYVVRDGVVQPAPAPRFSRTPGAIDRGPSIPGEHTREALADWGFDTADIDELVASGAAVEAV